MANKPVDRPVDRVNADCASLLPEKGAILVFN